MYTCHNQETLITVIPTSRHGQPYDIARVEAIFQLDQPITENDLLLVPEMEKIPKDLLEMLKLSKVNLAPMPESYVNEALSDFAQESADPNRDRETSEDAMLGLVRRYLTKINPQQIGTDYFYRVSYEYSVFPNSQTGSFFLYAAVPFKGFNMPAGSQVRFISVLPTGSRVINATGTDINSQPLSADMDDVAQGKPVVSYFWQNDPDFVVEYTY
ncbi:hypothetical protein WD019_15290 [Fictibacillus sp. Mic-4]|uniref:hypothetical protein n=1 Tax=Fictibacillus sp. Mic-4 TaxID=3132826 RepID=UPI003CEDAF52